MLLPLSFVPAAEIEEMARGLLARGARSAVPPVPVQVEWIAESVLDLRIEWRPLPFGEDGVVLAGLDAGRRVVALNELMQAAFEKTPGLERFSLAHEIGHWVMHVDRPMLEQPWLPGFDAAFPFLCRGDAESQREWQAERFAAALLMPRDLVVAEIEGLDLTRWPDRYRLRDRFLVSITAMTHRLRELGIGFVYEGKIYRTRAEALGQEPLF